MWVYGVGGSGKSALSFQMVRAAGGRNASAALPVLVGLGRPTLRQRRAIAPARRAGSYAQDGRDARRRRRPVSHRRFIEREEYRVRSPGLRKRSRVARFAQLS